MAEPTLNLRMTDLEQEVGDFLGYGLGTNGSQTAWTTYQQSDITRSLKIGLRNFYYPVLNGVLYEWSFLKPVASLLLASGTVDADLPDDFGYLAGPILLVQSNRSYREVPITGQVRSWNSLYPDRTGVPEGFVVEPLNNTTAARSTRYRLHGYPTADQDYTISVRYSVNPDFLTNTAPYVLGGAPHAETVRCACLAAAEATKNDARGIWETKYQERLAASVAYDRKLKPEHLAYNGDCSDEKWRRYSWPRDRYTNFVTFNGVQYDG